MTNTVNQQPLAVSPLLTDYALAWQGSQSPPTRKMTLAQVGSFSVPLTGGTMSGNLIIGSAHTLTVAGLITGQAGLTLTGGNMSLSSGNLTLVNGGLTVTGNSTLTGSLGVSSLAVTSGVTVAAGGIAVTGDSTITGSLGVSTLGVTGGITAGNGAAITGTLAVTGGLTVSASETITGILTVNGSTKTTGVTAYEYSSAGGAPVVGVDINYGILSIGSMIAASFVAVSDARMKPDAAPLSPEEGEAWVRASAPVTYTMNGVPGMGFIAQDQVRAGYDRYVFGARRPGLKEKIDDDGLKSKANEMMALNYAIYTAPLCAALQSALNKIDALTDRLTALEAP